MTAPNQPAPFRMAFFTTPRRVLMAVPQWPQVEEWIAAGLATMGPPDDGFAIVALTEAGMIKAANGENNLDGARKAP